jgi:hypothetical protein
MQIRAIGPLALGVVVIAGGCGQSAERESVQDAGAAVASAPSASEDTLPGELQDWRLHLRQMRGLRADSLRALLPGYRQRFSGMMGQGWMMGSRGGMPMMQGDSAWIALRDSLHQDMARLSGAADMSDEELERWMAAHQARALRMMQMYPGMHRGLR